MATTERRSPVCRRGEIWIAEMPSGIGSEQTGRRPVLIVQTDLINSTGYTNTIIVPISSSSKGYGSHVPIAEGKTSGLRTQSWAKCEQIAVISKDRLRGAKPLGKVPNQEMTRVDAALRKVLQLDVPPA